MINLAWDHNSYYHERLLRALPERCGRVLDVGCGTGELAARLAARADRVDALDLSPVMPQRGRTFCGNLGLQQIERPAGLAKCVEPCGDVVGIHAPNLIARPAGRNFQSRDK